MFKANTLTQLLAGVVLVASLPLAAQAQANLKRAGVLNATVLTMDGVAGVAGNGQQALADVLGGGTRPSAGTLRCAGKTIIADPRVQGVSLTGSERAGAAVAEIAGRHLKKVVLELGGSDPFILLSTDDMDATVEAAVAARNDNNGQACNAGKRFIVLEKHYDEFLTKFTAKMLESVPSDPMADDTYLEVVEALAAGPLAGELGGGVVDRDRLQNSRTVVGDGDLAALAHAHLLDLAVEHGDFGRAAVGGHGMDGVGAELAGVGHGLAGKGKKIVGHMMSESRRKPRVMMRPNMRFERKSSRQRGPLSGSKRASCQAA